MASVVSTGPVTTQVGSGCAGCGRVIGGRSRSRCGRGGAFAATDGYIDGSPRWRAVRSGRIERFPHRYDTRSGTRRERQR